MDMAVFERDEKALKGNWSVSSEQKGCSCPVCGLERLTVIFWSKQHCQKIRSPEFIDEDLYYEEKAEQLFDHWEKS